jgi:periplasmic protein TonB
MAMMFLPHPHNKVLSGVALAHALLLALFLWLPQSIPLLVSQPSMTISLLPNADRSVPRMSPPLPRPKQSERAPTPTVTPTVSSAANTQSLPEPSTAAPKSVSEIANAVSAPRFDAAYLNNPAPAYPPLSRRAGEEGRVLINVIVGADGLPKNLSIAQSSGSQRLDNAALNAVEKWKFVPARQAGLAMQATVNVPIVFKLDR